MSSVYRPTVAVVVPCFNGERFLGEALASVLAQDGVDLHVVVVDDGSTDGSAAVVADAARHDDRVQLVEQANAGVAAARNHGLDATSPATDAVLFLDADDVLEPGALERLAAALATAPDAVAAVGPHIRIDEDGQRLGVVPTSLGAHVIDDRGRVRWVDTVGELTWRHFLPGNAVFTPGQCLVRRQALPATPFDGSYTPAEDWELWLRLTFARRMVTVPAPVLRYRDNSVGLSKGYERMRARRQAILRSQRAAHPGDARLLDIAHWFVVYRADRARNLRWAGEQLRRGDGGAALRFAARAAKLAACELVARVRDRRTHWWAERPTADGCHATSHLDGVAP